MEIQIFRLGPGRFREYFDSPPNKRVEPYAAAVSYWTAVGLPIVYLSLLVSGIGTPTELGLFLGLLMVHIISLVGGRNYVPGSAQMN